MQAIYLAGGCFWGMEELFRDQPGVIDTEVGYMGGKNDNPTYEHHPGHAEALKVIYDDRIISYDELLDFFFRIHDPSTKKQTAYEIGTNYRSAIFYETAEQKQLAEQAIERIDASGLYDGNATTSLEPYVKFWPAEDEHQDYLQKHPGGYTCHYIRTKS